jgi:hypothetical protein
MYKLDKNNKISIHLINGAVAKDVSAQNFPLLLMYICGNSFRFLSFSHMFPAKTKNTLLSTTAHVATENPASQIKYPKM